MIKALAVSKCFYCWCYILLLITLAAGALHTLSHDDTERIAAHHLPNVDRAVLIDQAVNLCQRSVVWKELMSEQF